MSRVSLALVIPDHFFEVELHGVARHAAGSMLNRDAVRSYVSEVCPVPMAAAFPYARESRGVIPSEPATSCHWTSLWMGTLSQ